MQHDDSLGDDCECFRCKVLSISINPYAMPSRLNPKNAPRQPQNKLADHTPTDERGMPFLDKNLQPMTAKQVSENRHRIEQVRRKNHNLSTERRP